MKLSLKSLFSRRDRAPQRPARHLPTHDEMYIAHMRRKADDHAAHQGWERRFPF